MPTIQPIDFSTTALTHYSGFYATIIDDLLTPAECDTLKELASSTGEWQPAGLMAHGTTETVHANFRNSDRVLRVDADVADMIYERLRPLVPELHVITPDSEWASIVGKPAQPGKKTQKPSWRMVRVNPRLSFLRYGPGHYFKQHCDGLNELLDGPTSQKSFVTLHLYLNGEVSGGATRFWTPDKKHFLDVEPKVGRVLVFQQRMLVHSGEEVTEGIKYTMRSDFMFEQV
ncbi:hypothetical protein DFH08DRAFT_840277 [Mycena albidolilacea]|uniref:Prolyl 4-hydroxylase alpha subunit domain-containing protein n=1 Tax=Mycena albidolilacea TaxID=1033008 RepID=A0AAD7AQJ1_9AGAR|nr:hypothetical protein DFH08DRAFT_840277 [Mycena albidolilacea]